MPGQRTVSFLINSVSSRASRAGMHDSVGFMVLALGEGALTLMRSFPTEW